MYEWPTDKVVRVINQAYLKGAKILEVRVDGDEKNIFLFEIVSATMLPGLPVPLMSSIVHLEVEAEDMDSALKVAPDVLKQVQAEAQAAQSVIAFPNGPISRG